MWHVISDAETEICDVGCEENVNAPSDPLRLLLSTGPGLRKWEQEMPHADDKAMAESTKLEWRAMTAVILETLMTPVETAVVVMMVARVVATGGMGHHLLPLPKRRPDMATVAIDMVAEIVRRVRKGSLRGLQWQWRGKRQARHAYGTGGDPMEVSELLVPACVCFVWCACVGGSSALRIFLISR